MDEDIRGRITNIPLHKTLMQSLYYPAVLGAVLVFLLRKFGIYYNSALMSGLYKSTAALAVNDISNYYGIFLLLYCSMTYLETYLIRPDNMDFGLSF